MLRVVTKSSARSLANFLSQSPVDIQIVQIVVERNGRHTAYIRTKVAGLKENADGSVAVVNPNESEI